MIAVATRSPRTPWSGFGSNSLTKPADAKGEPFVPLDEATFKAGGIAEIMRSVGERMGYSYGIPAGAVRAALAGDKRVVVNLSRTVRRAFAGEGDRNATANRVVGLPRAAKPVG